MIEVMWMYYSKKNHAWTKQTSKFDDPIKALRFIRKIDGKKDSFVTGYSSWDNECVDYINSRYHIKGPKL